MRVTQASPERDPGEVRLSALGDLTLILAAFGAVAALLAAAIFVWPYEGLSAVMALVGLVASAAAFVLRVRCGEFADRHGLPFPAAVSRAAWVAAASQTVIWTTVGVLVLFASGTR